MIAETELIYRQGRRVFSAPYMRQLSLLSSEYHRLFPLDMQLTTHRRLHSILKNCCI